MSVVIRFTSPGMTAAKYDECIKRLEQAGAGAPAGRLYHVCFGDPNDLRISDIWESTEAFHRFGETLMPILQQLEIDPGTPEIVEIHNSIEGIKAGTATP